MLFGFILLIFCLVCVVGSLLFGIVALAKGGEFNAKYGNKAMVARVVFQGLALAILLLLIAAK